MNDLLKEYYEKPKLELKPLYSRNGKYKPELAKKIIGKFARCFRVTIREIANQEISLNPRRVLKTDSVRVAFIIYCYEYGISTNCIGEVLNRSKVYVSKLKSAYERGEYHKAKEYLEDFKSRN
jgi:hypothetical protein